MAGFDRRQLLNDLEVGIMLALDGRQSTIWTALPCIVKSVDFTKMTIEAQPAIQGTVEDESGALQSVNLPLLVDVPICFPSAGGFTITVPISAGDEVLVIFSSRCIDAWWQSGGVQKPMEMRMHDLSDGFAILGPKSKPNVISNISATDIEIRNDTGTTYLSITDDGKIGFKNATTELKIVLTDLETLLNTFMTTLSGFAGGGAPVSQAMLQAPAATAVTALSAVLTKIGALLK
jgi:hypothetical protein